MRLSLCNEVVRELAFERQCALAATLGYAGLEIAPFTLAEDPTRLSAARLAEIRRALAGAGVACSGLHWLLVAPDGLSITTADAAAHARTIEVMRRLIGLCAELGGAYLVHGSPAQRRTGGDAAAAARGEAAWRAVAADAERAGVTYCIEALAPPEADFVNTIAEAAAIARRIGSPAVRTMLDTSAAGNAESQTPAALLDRWLPTGLIAHVQLNDRNRRGPGQGSDRFGPVLVALRRHGYAGWLAIEPFEYVPDGPGAAAHAIGYVRGALEALA
jgi:sugar phosphate isomerase/epimerase